MLQHPASWSNLAALGIGLGDAAGASAHAQRALQLDHGLADAWVNYGVASWMLQRRKDAALAMHQALQLAPGLEAAALNFARMQQAVGQGERALEILRDAVAHAPDSAQLALALAEQSRLQMRHEETREAAVGALRALSMVFDPGLPGRSGLRPSGESDARAVLHAACAELDVLGVTYHLTAGTLLAITKDGRLFPHDKDIDLALPDLEPEACEQVRAHFAGNPAYRMYPPPPPPAPTTVIGLEHIASGIGVDLLLPRSGADGCMRNQMGWPDALASEVPAYRIGSLHWDGRDWPVPEPVDGFLAAMYGDDWREQRTTAAGIEYDRCYSDTMLSNPSRTAESAPRAVTLGLIRLVHALRGQAWSKSVAYCAQLLAREEIPEVRRVLARLQAAGHDGLRFDG